MPHPGHQPHVCLPEAGLAIARLRRNDAGAVQPGAHSQLHRALVCAHRPPARLAARRRSRPVRVAQAGHLPQRPPAVPGRAPVVADAHGQPARLAGRQFAGEARGAVLGHGGPAARLVGKPEIRSRCGWHSHDAPAQPG